MSENLSRMHRDMDAFYSSGYLQCWCSNVKIEWTEFLDRAFSAMIPQILGFDEHDHDRKKVLDIGCGPSISNVISASKWSSQIVMADYLASNRAEVKRFVDNADDAFQWNHYLDFLGVLELNPDTASLASRTRNSIKNVIFCDVTKPEIFLPEDKIDRSSFDVIVASLVFDVVAVSEKMFKTALSNVLQYLKPGGLILIHGSLGEHVYTVGSAIFPAMTADELMLRNIFEACDLEVVRWETCVKLTTHYYTLLRLRDPMSQSSD